MKPDREPAANPPETRRKRSRRRTWILRLAAVGFGFLLLAVFELACWGFGWGRPSHAEDPFVGFRDIHPLFEPDESGENYEIPPVRLNFFAPESFPVEKPEGTFRIFCFGGSTVQGRPWSTPTSFTKFLELALSQADPRWNWEVINCGGVSYASYRLVPILRECLQYDPDLFILCTGHNEFLEDRSYGHLKRTPRVLALPQKWLSRTRTYTLLRTLLTTPPERPTLGEETTPILDYHDSLKAYQRDEDWHAGVMAHFESNLGRMITISEEGRVPLLGILPPSNLSACPPFKTLHREGITAEEKGRFAERMKEAKELYASDLAGAIGKIKQALKIDEQYAAAWYELGECYRSMGLKVQAREAFIRARDEDICPLRMISKLEARFRDVFEDTETPWLDAHALLEQDSREGILGGQLLIDHVHPTIEGYQKIADALVELMGEQGIADPQDRWKADAHRVYEEHVRSLGEFYFLKGMRTREALRGWTQGRAVGPEWQPKE